jgi:error-prone DNA polymerase
MVFQEQLSQAAIHLAGFDPGEADSLRKVVTKKNREKKLRDFCTRFVRGAREYGVRQDVIENVWQMIMGFDGYSFCKPHSASYTLVAYKSAYLRAHYPAEFMASVIANGGGYYSTFGYISEARRMGLEILPPDINLSEIKYIGKDKTIRIGFMQLKDLAQVAKEAIIHERSKNGPFTSLESFLKRTRPHVHLQDVRVLIKAGCFDGVAPGLTRPALLWQALRFFGKDDIPAQTSLLDTAPSQTLSPDGLKPNMPVPAPYTKSLVLKHEVDTLGFFLSVHPLDRFEGVLKGLDYVKARDLHSKVGNQVTTIGWQVTGKTVHTKDGDPMKFISFEDTTDIYETVLFPKVYDRYCHMLNKTRPYILKGKVEETFGAVNLRVDWIGFLDRYKTPTPKRGKRTTPALTMGNR